MAKKKKNLKFNKKNAIAFANMIYSDCNGSVQFLKLCETTLENGKDGNRTLHCGVGEAYFHFVNDDMHSLFQEADDDGGATDDAIRALVKIAHLKGPKKNRALTLALHSIVELNDSVSGDAPSQYVIRSEQVATQWLANVVPLLNK